jgi:hypothetical protein
MAGRPARNNDTAVRPYRRCRTDGQVKILETVIESTYRILAVGRFPNNKTDGNAVVLYR